MEFVKEKIKEIMTKTIEQNRVLKCDDIANADHFKMFMGSDPSNVFKLLGFNCCSYMCTYNDKKSVVVFFSVPINEKTTTKTSYEKVIELVKNLEENLITLDYITTKESKEEKQVYLTLIKSVPTQ